MHYLSELVIALNNFMPLAVFVFLAGIIEEIVAPIPSPIVMTFAGAASLSLGKPIYWVFIYGLLGGLGKSLGAWFLYVLADKFEDLFTNKFGKFFGLKPHHFESYGKKLANTSKTFWWLLFARCLPIAPSGVISVLSGVLRVSPKVYLASTVLGCIFRDTVYVFIGYTSNEFLQSVVDHSMSIDKLLTFCVALLILIYFIYLAKKRR